MTRMSGVGRVKREQDWTEPGVDPDDKVEDPLLILADQLHVLISQEQECSEPDGDPMCYRLATELIRLGWRND
jgi:hypothetical protein